MSALLAALLLLVIPATYSNTVPPPEQHLLSSADHPFGLPAARTSGAHTSGTVRLPSTARIDPAISSAVPLADSPLTYRSSSARSAAGRITVLRI
jgi:hypothetical protein